MDFPFPDLFRSAFFDPFSAPYPTNCTNARRSNHRSTTQRASSGIPPSFRPFFPKSALSSSPPSTLSREIHIRLEDCFTGTVLSVSYERQQKCSHCLGCGSLDNPNGERNNLNAMQTSGSAPHSSFSSVFPKCDVCKGNGRIFTSNPKQAQSETVRKRKFAPCHHCQGTGESSMTCPDCKGSGKRSSGVSFGTNGYRVSRNSRLVPCDSCHAKGKVAKRVACTFCSEKGLILQETTFSLTIEPGVEDGDELVFKNRGHERVFYDVNASNTSNILSTARLLCGDLKIIIRVLPHSCFQRVGPDLYFTKTLPLSHALLGCRFSFKHLDGSPICVDTENVILNGKESRRIVGEGMPRRGSSKRESKIRRMQNRNIQALSTGVHSDRSSRISGNKELTDSERGDLILKFKVEFPERLSESARELLEKQIPHDAHESTSKGRFQGHARGAIILPCKTDTNTDDSSETLHQEYCIAHKQSRERYLSDVQNAKEFESLKEDPEIQTDDIFEEEYGIPGTAGCSVQ